MMAGLQFFLRTRGTRDSKYPLTLVAGEMNVQLDDLRTARTKLMANQAYLLTKDVCKDFDLIGCLARSHQQFINAVDARFSPYSLTAQQADKVNQFSNKSKEMFQKFMRQLVALLQKEGNYGLANFVTNKLENYSCGFSFAYTPCDARLKPTLDCVKNRNGR